MKKITCILLSVLLLLSGTLTAFAASSKPVITSNLPRYIYVDADSPDESMYDTYFTVNASIEATGDMPLSYKWYYYDSAVDIPQFEVLEGQNTNELKGAKLSYDSVLFTTYIYCEVTDSAGNSVCSDRAKIVPVESAKVTVPEKLVFSHSDSKDGAYQCTLKAETDASDDISVKYDWFCEKKDGQITQLNEFGDTLDISVKEETILEGISFYCEVTLGETAVSVSNKCKIQLEPFFKEAPSGKAGLEGEYGEMTVKAYSTEELSYKWYMSKNGTDWLEITDGEEYSGTLTPTLRACTPNEEFLTVYFRCEVSSKNTTIISEAAHFSKPDIIIEKQPESVETPLGGEAVFTIQATAMNLEYRWEMYSPVDDAWVKTAATDSTLKVQVRSENAYEYRFRCVLSDGEKELVSDEVSPLYSDKVTLGDIDFDGKITAADARLALRASVGLENYETAAKKFTAADMDFDGKITAADARIILRTAVGLSKISDE